MATKQPTNLDIVGEINNAIDEINDLIKTYTIPGIILLLIGFGLILLLITYLPYIVGILLVALLGYLAYLKFR